LVLQLQIN